MDLQKVIEKINKESLENNSRAFEDVANSEDYIKQSYEGRYFFELIQNIRDANFEADIHGIVSIEIEDDHVKISNTGTGFSEKGIESITKIGSSTKEGSQEYIGHKGIGFKSVMEITDSPKITTKDGSMYFDKELAIQKHKDLQSFSSSKIPLFWFPHYSSNSLGNDSDFVTSIELKYKVGISAEKVFKDFQNLSHEQIVLLGNLKKIECSYKDELLSFEITENNDDKTITVRYNESEFFYRKFSPSEKIKVSEKVINELSEKEKKLFNEGLSVDLKILIKLDNEANFNMLENPSLYLYYPLEIKSGFKFLIHSLFIVSPDRKNLRIPEYNIDLLKKIGKYLGSEFLEEIKRTYNSNVVLDILKFERVDDPVLDSLHDSLVEELKQKDFIYNEKTSEFINLDDVIIADDFDEVLFPKGLLGEKKIIFLDANKRDWLRDEFNVDYLSEEKLSEIIENECERQKSKHNIDFFQNLYNYISEHNNFNFEGKKIYLTSDFELVSDEEFIFYGGTKSKSDLNFPKSVQKTICFLHPEIKISEFENQTTHKLKKYDGVEIVRKLKKLFDTNIPNDDILNSILQVELTDKIISEIRYKIPLPVKGQSEWLYPQYNPIYLESKELKELYPDGYFLDMSQIIKSAVNDINSVLLRLGVWDIPGVYINKYEQSIYDDTIINRLSKSSGLASNWPYYIKFDRKIDKPNVFNKWFTTQLFENWWFYENFLTNSDLPKMKFRSPTSGLKSDYPRSGFLPFTSFINSLKDWNWIYVDNKNEAYSPSELLGIDEFEFKKPHWKKFINFFNVLPSNYSKNKRLLQLLDLPHLHSHDLIELIKIISRVESKYQIIIDEPYAKELYNKILFLLHESYRYNENQENLEDRIQELRLKNFLCFNEFEDDFSFNWGNEIYYKDNPTFYKLLPNLVKRKLQPQFTNQDKNTFGRIACKIGKKITDSIELELIDSKELYRKYLRAYEKFLPEMVALLEYEIERSLNDQEINFIKESIIIEKETIKTKIIIEGSEIDIIDRNSYSEKSKPCKLYILKPSINQNNNQIKSEAITGLFSGILERDFKRLENDILRLLNEGNKKQFLDTLNIAHERIIELRNKLEAATKNTKQAFISDLLETKDITFENEFFDNDDLNYEELSAVLNTSKDDFKRLIESINFNSINSESNFSHLYELLNLLKINTSEFNKNSTFKIDFTQLHLNELKRIRNKYADAFDIQLYHILLKEDDSVKKQFVKFKEYYENYSFEIVEDDFLNRFPNINYEKTFEETLLKNIKNFNFKLDDLRNLEGTENLNEIYKENRKQLIELLKSKKLSTEELDEFLESKEKISLLQLNATQYLIQQYRKYLKEINLSKKTDENDINLSDFYKDSKINILDDHTPKSPNIEVGFSNNGGYKKNLSDGSKNDKNKQKIGLVSELLVFKELYRKYKNVKWVSKNASRIEPTFKGYNPLGSDDKGYDIEYIDDDGNKIYVEVKSSSSDNKRFIITQPELNFAISKKESYKLIFVSNVFNEKNRKSYDIKNPFILDEDEDFMNNSKFKAINKNFEIAFE